MSNYNVRNGSGRGIPFANYPTAEVVDTSLIPTGKQPIAYARGVECTEDGTLNVRLAYMDSDILINVQAGVPKLYDIVALRSTGGSITPDGTNVMLFW